MPLYEYVCMECESHFEQLRAVAEADTACPSCGGSRVSRQFSVFAAGRPSSETGGRGAPARASSGGCACGGACACGR